MDENRRVVVLHADYPHYQLEQELLSPYGATVVSISTDCTDEKEIRQELANADALLVREASVDAARIATMNRCKIIVRYGAGVDNIDLHAAKQKNIFVANIPQYGGDEVANHALALLLAVSRHIVTRDRDVRQGSWDIGADQPIYSFQRKTLGIIGYGRIGQAFHRKAAPLGFAQTLVHDPMTITNADVIQTELDDLCQRADVISLHLPLTKDNYHLLDQTKLLSLKKNCILINTSRGSLIDEQALIQVLQAKQIFGAGLDVFEIEPPTTASPLFQLDNVVVTDHMGWYSEESLQDLQTKAAQEVARVFAGQKPRFWVNRWED
jgi:D-3-phosphoglycerate dehydrogenase